MGPGVRGYFVVLVAAVGCSCGQAGTPAAPTPLDLQSSLSALFDTLAIPANSACSLSVSQHGEVILEKGRGQIGPGIQASADSLYRIASLTKPITATAVLISERAGRLNRTEKINEFVAFPEPAPTVDELIKHIPGLNDYVLTPEFQTASDSPTTLEALLSLIQPWDGVRRHQYSSSHYALLGAMLQQANGLRYEVVVQRDIFGPAGMSRSSFAVPPASESFPFPFTAHPSWVYAAGGITSTAADMNRFNQALLNDRFGFGAVESFDRSDGVTSFGMGSSVSGVGDLRFTHAGALNQYSSASILFPSDKSSVVVLCSFNNPDVVFNFAMGLRNLMLAAR
jgi:CubicO group peptidase (beta-lactamase class C family)